MKLTINIELSKDCSLSQFNNLQKDFMAIIKYNDEVINKWSAEVEK